MKKLILTIGICALGLAGFSATDAEIKEMLAKKDYMSAAVNIKSVQLTNGVVTAADVNGLVDAAIKTNVRYKVVALCNANMYTFADAIAACEAIKKPDVMLYIAKQSKNTDLMVEAWSKALDMPETTGKTLIDYCPNIDIREANLELFKRSAEKILKEYPQAYVHYVFSYHAKTSEYKEWSMSCLKNIKENTFEGVWAWPGLYNYDTRIAKTGFARTNDFYFEKAFTQINFVSVKYYINYIYRCKFKDKAIETMAKSIIEPDTAFEFSNHVDARENNKEMTKRMFPVISKDVKLGLDAALCLNDTNKIIDMLLAAKEELTAEQLDKVIPVINSLSADYRAADVVKALRDINARYTLKLYDDRKTWEPILSKIRALIDVRQM
jgi:hypothetical protein